MRRISDPVECFRALLYPKERPGSLSSNQYCDFRIGVAMCFEKRFGVECEEVLSENVLMSEAIESTRSFIRGRREWAQPCRIRRPRRAGRRAGVTGGSGIGKVPSFKVSRYQDIKVLRY